MIRGERPTADDVEAVRWSFDALLKQAAKIPRRTLLPACRCGWRDESPLGTPPVRVPILDLTDAPGVFSLDRTPIRRACRACTHPILHDRACVSHQTVRGHAARDLYHAECVDIPQEIR